MSPFIVIEGLDGAGTTTQVALLRDALCADGHAAVATREPTAGPIGKVIRQTLSGDPEAPRVESLPWMFAADRADHLHRFVEPALSDGTVVISDRYVPSSLAYQSLTLPLEQVFALNAAFRVPDLLIMVDVPVATCLSRIGARSDNREIYEREDQLTAIHAAYQRVLKRLSERGDPIARVDGTPPVAVVQAAIASHVREADLWPLS